MHETQPNIKNLYADITKLVHFLNDFDRNTANTIEDSSINYIHYGWSISICLQPQYIGMQSKIS